MLGNEYVKKTWQCNGDDELEYDNSEYNDNDTYHGDKIEYDNEGNDEDDDDK